MNNKIIFNEIWEILSPVRKSEFKKAYMQLVISEFQLAKSSDNFKNVKEFVKVVKLNLSKLENLETEYYKEMISTAKKKKIDSKFIVVTLDQLIKLFEQNDFIDCVDIGSLGGPPKLFALHCDKEEKCMEEIIETLKNIGWKDLI